MISCICINDKEKPKEIPNTHWIEKGKEYNVIMIYNMVNQGAILGVVLRGIDLESLDIGYSCFRMDRFAFKLEDLDKLIALAKDCADLNGFDIEELIREQELVPIEI
jgi:hypothetical protein